MAKNKRILETEEIDGHTWFVWPGAEECPTEIAGLRWPQIELCWVGEPCDHEGKNWAERWRVLPVGELSGWQFCDDFTGITHFRILEEDTNGTE